MNDKDIFVVGYPKSGNSWISRLLGRYLNSPVTGWGNIIPISSEGNDRTGDYTVRQLHLRANTGLELGNIFVHGAYLANLSAWNGEKIVLVMRDPRDVVVSAMHYWEMDSIKQAIIAVGEGAWPLSPFGSWSSFYHSWFSNVPAYVPICKVRYEDLSANGELEFFRILNFLGLADDFDERVKDAFAKEHIDAKRKEIENDGDIRQYGKTIQLYNLRKGVVGDWKNHSFSENDIALCRYYFQALASIMGYKDDWD